MEMTLRLPDELYDALLEEAKARDMTVNRYIAALLADLL